MSFSEAGRKVIEGASAGLYEAGTIIMASSQVLVPVDTGTLKRSGRVEEPVLSDDGDSIEVVVGYGYGEAYQAKAQGDGDEDVGPGYGVYVHERVVTASGHVVRHDPPTQAKYLSVPAKAVEPEFEGIIEANVKMRLRGV